MTLDEAIPYFKQARGEEELQLKACEDYPADLKKLADYRKALWWRLEANCRLREALQATPIERGHA
jgi:hypothetical protein